jgi:hypothetical protein
METKQEPDMPFGAWIHTGSEPTRLLCPYCGSDHIMWIEEVIEERTPRIEGGILWIEGPGEHVSESGSNERLECRSCFKDVAIPSDPGIELDYR